MFYFVGKVVDKPLPAHVPPAIVGDWDAEDGRTSVRITRFNIATFRGFAEGEAATDITVRGPVEYGEDEITAGFSFMRLVTLIVDTWPTQRGDGSWVMEINGVKYTRR